MTSVVDQNVFINCDLSVMYCTSISKLINEMYTKLPRNEWLDAASGVIVIFGGPAHVFNSGKFINVDPNHVRTSFELMKILNNLMKGIIETTLMVLAN